MRRRSRAKRSRLSGVLSLVAALWTAPALAAPDAAATLPIVIEVPQRSDRLLEEAVLRIQGELAAMGLEAEVTSSSAPTDAPNDPAATKSASPGGRLKLVREGNLVRISAVGPSSPSTFVQELDARAPDISAEVVAVRAVEALRAVMTLPERRTEKPAPKPVPPPPVPPPKVAPAPPQNPSVAHSIAPHERSTLSIWSGVQGFYDVSLAAPGLGGELGVFWGRSSLFAGLTGGVTLLRTTIHADEGDVDIRRGNVFARVGYALGLGGPFEASFMAGAGWSRFLIDGHASTGYVGVSLHRDTPVVLVALGLNAWFSQYFAAYLRADATLSTNAPEVRANFQELGVLDRPTLWASLGVAVRLPQPFSQ